MYQIAVVSCKIKESSENIPFLGIVIRHPLDGPPFAGLIVGTANHI